MITYFQPYIAPRYITLLALNLRFTREERDAIRAAEISDPDVSDAMYLMRQARYIDLDRVETIASVNALEAKGLLGVGRAAIVLSGEVSDIERP
jgi:hypothetical protein